MSNFKAVLLDWRGTLVVSLGETEWVQRGLELLGRESSPAAVESVLSKLRNAQGLERLEVDGVDSDARQHRSVYFQVFSDAGVDPELAEALYQVESDPDHNPFALDAATVLAAIKQRGVRIAVISDIHFDIRPAFAKAGLDRFVDLFVLSFEHGVQKPEPAIFELALRALSLRAADVLMVGDRAAFDGAAVDLGIATLLLPPLTSIHDLRLHLVNNLLS